MGFLFLALPRLLRSFSVVHPCRLTSHTHTSHSYSGAARAGSTVAGRRVCARGAPRVVAVRGCWAWRCYLCHVMSSCHVRRCRVMSRHVMLCLSCDGVLCSVMSCQVVSCHVMSCHVMSVVSRCVASCRIALCRSALCRGCCLDALSS